MIQETVPAKGAMVTDMLRQDSFLLADRALSRSGTPGMMFAMRLIFFDDFAIQSGAAIPIYAELAEMPEFLHLMQKLVPSPEQLPDGTFRMTSAQEAKFAQGLMAISLREGYTERIAYE